MTLSSLDNENGNSPSEGSVTCWIDLFRLGDEEAASRLWARYFAPLVGVARTKLGHYPSRALDAEDVALSAFHAFYRAATADRLPELNNRDDLWQSMLLITFGKVVDTKRREFSQKRGGTKTIQGFSDLLELVESHESDPSVAACVADEMDRLMQCLGERELQEIAILKLEGYTHDEIATKLDCSERTIKRRLAVIRRIWEETELAP